MTLTHATSSTSADEHEEDARDRRRRVRAVGFGPRLAFRNHPRAHGLVGVGVLGLELLGLHVDRRLRLRAAHARRQPADHVQRMLVALGDHVLILGPSAASTAGRYASNSTSA